MYVCAGWGVKRVNTCAAVSRSCSVKALRRHRQGVGYSQLQTVSRLRKIIYHEAGTNELTGKTCIYISGKKNEKGVGEGGKG